MHGHKPECICVDCETEKYRPPMPVNQNKPDKGREYRLNELRVRAAIEIAAHSPDGAAGSVGRLCNRAAEIVTEMDERGWIP